MTRRLASRSLTPFEFRADFAPPPSPEPARITLSPTEFTALLDEARAQGHALAEHAVSEKVAGEITALQTRLHAAMADLAAIARHLEAVTRRAEAAHLAPTLLPTCQRILDAQADLFPLTLPIGEETRNP